MIPVATSDQIRQAEEQFFAANPGIDLMERAAEAVVKTAKEMLPVPDSAKILVAAGPGNNGGDGLFAAAKLAGEGHEVVVWQIDRNIHVKGLQQALGAGASLIDQDQLFQTLSETDLVIDAVLGIGGRPGLPEGVAQFVGACNDMAIPVLSIDLPSGLASDQVVDYPSFSSSKTVTFIAPKICHIGQPARSRCGEITVADIGVDPLETNIYQVTKADLARLWPLPGPTSNKYSRGVVGINAGSEKYPGAGILACFGAVYSGAGMVRFAGGQSVQNIIKQVLPSVVHGVGQVDAWVIGPGWGQVPDGKLVLESLLALGKPAVVDADALNYLPAGNLSKVLLSPHAGELARLLETNVSQIVADPIGSCRQAAKKTGACVLLKGAAQYVVSPDETVLICVPGPYWNAQAGSGDVLAGICGTLLAAGLSPLQAGALGASVQALASKNLPGTWPPDQIVTALPQVIADLAEIYPAQSTLG